MMTKYFVLAGSQSYGYLHGMYSAMVVEIADVVAKMDVERELNEYGNQMSEEVIEAYSTILDEDDYESEDEYFEAINDEISYEIFKVKAKYQELSVEELEALVAEYGGEDFADEYCEDFEE